MTAQETSHKGCVICSISLYWQQPGDLYEELIIVKRRDKKGLVCKLNNNQMQRWSLLLGSGGIWVDFVGWVLMYIIVVKFTECVQL